MDLLTCEYCGMEFSKEYTHCPLCGRSVHPTLAGITLEEPIYNKKTGGVKLGKRGGRFAAKAKPAKEPKAPKAEKPEKEPKESVYGIPTGMMIAICVILAVAVIAGAAFALYNLGYLDFLFAPKEVMEEPVAPAPEAPQKAGEAQYVNEEDYQPVGAGDQVGQQLISCTGLTLGTTTITFEEIDQFYNMTVALTPQDCTQEVIFASTDERVVTVNQQGKIMAVGGGVAEVTVTCGDYSAVCLVTCDFLTQSPIIQETTPPSLSSEEMVLTYPGQQATLLVNDIEEGAVVAFESQDDSIATIDETGIITAVSSGTTTVTATVYDLTLTCTVSCTLDDSAESGGDEEAVVTISHSDVTMTLPGEYFRLSLRDSNGDRITGVAWTSSDAEICTVDEDGVVYAEGRGTTTVYTTYNGQSFECIIRCAITE